MADSNPTATERGLGVGLRLLNRLASSDLLDRIGMRERAERLVHGGVKGGLGAAGAAGRTFKATQKLGRPARQSTGKRRDLFDLTPDDEQSMMQEAVGDFGLEKLRPAAHDADAAAAPPEDLLAQANELGVAMLGVPEDLGGVLAERSAVTSVLVSEALAKGDMGLAVAALAPGAVSTAIGLWGDADQQATYLGEFTGENPPAAGLAVIEPRALFDPFTLETTARVADGGYVLSGVKSLVPRVAESELFVVAAALEDRGPALFIVESKTEGVLTGPEPAMGIRAAATGQLQLDDVKVGSAALLAEGDPEAYADCIRLGRIAWSALATGTSQAVLDYVSSYVNEREAFGEPISNRQAVAFMVSDIAIETTGLRLATYRAAGRVDHGRDYARESATARRLANRHGMQIGSDGVQLLGGHGYTKEHPVERWYRDLRAAGMLEGVLLV